MNKKILIIILLFNINIFSLSPNSFSTLKENVLSNSLATRLQQIVDITAKEIAKEMSSSLSQNILIHSYVVGSTRYLQIDEDQKNRLIKDIDIILDLNIEYEDWLSINFDYESSSFHLSETDRTNKYIMNSVNDGALKRYFEQKLKKNLKFHLKQEIVTNYEYDIFIYKQNVLWDSKFKLAEKLLNQISLLHKERLLNDDGTITVNSQSNNNLWKYGNKFISHYSNYDNIDFITFGVNFFLIKQILQLQFYLDSFDNYYQTLIEFINCDSTSDIIKLAEKNLFKYRELKKIIKNVLHRDKKKNNYNDLLIKVTSRITGPIRPYIKMQTNMLKNNFLQKGHYSVFSTDICA